MSHFKEKNWRSMYRWLCQCWWFLFFFSTRDPQFCVRLWEWQCADGDGLQNHHFVGRRKCVKKAGIKNLNKKRGRLG